MGDLSDNFSRREFECSCGCGFDTVDIELVKALQDVRDYFGKPVKISSGCRCPLQNKRVKGSLGSQHMEGRAADFSVAGVQDHDVQAYVKTKYPDKYGIGCYGYWTHLDTRGGCARWRG